MDINFPPGSGGGGGLTLEQILAGLAATEVSAGSLLVGGADADESYVAAILGDAHVLGSLVIDDSIIVGGIVALDVAQIMTLTTGAIICATGDATSPQIKFTSQAPPVTADMGESGGLWFDGTNLKLRVGTTTKTITMI